ncbi:MAG: hypothetical protein ABIQ35_04420 [Verrucomicrobiota bacterium]
MNSIAARKNSARQVDPKNRAEKLNSMGFYALFAGTLFIATVLSFQTAKAAIDLYRVVNSYEEKQGSLTRMPVHPDGGIERTNDFTPFA